MNFPRRPVLMIFFLLLAIAFLLPTSAYSQSEYDLILNYIEAKPLEGQMAYDVTATFSFLDSAGNPIKDLQMDQINLSEDGQGVAVQTLDNVTDQPIFVSLLIDTSGSMTGTKIEEAKKAAQQFIDGLNPNDKISVTTFNSNIELLIDLSSDHEAAKDLIGSIKAESGSGTCLYDSLYGAVQRTAAYGLGRRAIIVLSDGKDEDPKGGPCSKLTIDDAIDLASEGNTRVPVFSIGLGQSVDEQSLSRIALLTGGRFDKTPDATQLGTMFSRLLDLLQSQYQVHYTSTAAPGNHTLVLTTKYLESQQTDSRDFLLQELPLYISILSPVTGEQVTGQVNIVASISGQGKPIQKVIFLIDEVVIGTDELAPYEIQWTPSEDASGEIEISVIALGTDNEELAKNRIVVNIAPEIPTQNPLPSDSSNSSSLFSKDNLLLFGGILALLVVATIVFFVLTTKKRNETKSKDQRWQDTVAGTPGKSSSNEMTMDGFILGENALGALTVMQSDDPAMVGQRFEISENITRLGRAADNDLFFPKDAPVSRHHAMIESINGGLTLSELVSSGADGANKTPTFGTFVNDTQISRATTLSNGDFIRLGKRLTLKFEAKEDQSTIRDDPRTIDQFDSNEDTEKTMDSF